MSAGMPDGLFSAFIDWLYQSGDIKVPADFHSRCSYIQRMIDNDNSAIVNTVLDYAINSASETSYKIESDEEGLEELLNLWLDQVNVNINGVPFGLQQLSKEYFRERWAGSSLCLMRVGGWKDITLNKNTISVPTVLWFVNGSSVHIKRPKDVIYTLGSDKYFLDAGYKTELISDRNDQIIVQKPYSRWYEQYPTPYLVKTGVLKNFLTLKNLQEKVDEIISKVLPYLFVIEKGTEEMAKEGITYTDPELQQFVDNFKQVLEKYRVEKGRTPAHAVPFDQKYSHLIPDLLPILKKELYDHLYRVILQGLGFVDVVQGVTSSRKEAILNPKPFMSEINAGVSGFKDMLMGVVNLIITENKEAHKKLFSDANYLNIVSAPLKINTEAILDIIRQEYDRGLVSKKSMTEAIGFDYETEVERRKKELKDGEEEIMYPPVIMNQEANMTNEEINRVTPSKKRNLEKIENPNLEKEGKKKGTPEAQNYKNAKLEEELIIAPWEKNETLPEYLQYLPEGAKTAFRKTFNDAYPKGEDYAFPVAYTVMKRWLSKHGYKKVNNKWEKK